MPSEHQYGAGVEEQSSPGGGDDAGDEDETDGAGDVSEAETVTVAVSVTVAVPVLADEVVGTGVPVSVLVSVGVGVPVSTAHELEGRNETVNAATSTTSAIRAPLASRRAHLTPPRTAEHQRRTGPRSRVRT